MGKQGAQKQGRKGRRIYTEGREAVESLPEEVVHLSRSRTAKFEIQNYFLYAKRRKYESNI